MPPTEHIYYKNLMCVFTFLVPLFCNTIGNIGIFANSQDIYIFFKVVFDD